MSTTIGLHAGSDSSKTQYEAFSTWLGQSVTTRIVFADNSSWGGISSPYMLGTTKTWLAKGSQYRDVITIGLCPTANTPSSSGVHLSAVAAGNYDSYFTTLGQNLANMGNNPATGKPYANQVVIRLGHELNGDWYQWGIGGTASNKPGSWNTPTDYKNAYARVVGLIRAKASGVKFDWNWAMNGRAITGTYAAAYPGNAYVDYITADVYDDFHSGSWAALLNGTGGILNGGLTAFRAFAQSNGKPECYPEWACDTSSNGYGDSVVFIVAMSAWFLAAPNGIGYQSYYDTSAWAGNAVIHTGTVTCPRASQSYRTLMSKPNLVLTKIAGSLVNGIFTPVSTPPKNLGSYCDGSNFYYLS
jgi:hypothetical protein